ncbi:MAG TPA: ester cyclase [Anaerolineae bacterium]|nr:ester cyclase [Anaerolineae bacterium]HOQ98951.1 ester cyclase [Anaerolineae bacterium]HPL30027.1 ester cyclase [Anaerolineae bacterium]
MSAVQNKETVHRYIDETFNKGNLAVIDEVLAPSFVDHNPTPGQATGPMGAIEFARNFRSAFPDLHVNIEEMVAEGDKVAMRSTIRGTQKGEFMGISPTGMQVSWQAMAIFRVASGKILERWSSQDHLGLLQQLGAIPERLMVSTVR